VQYSAAVLSNRLRALPSTDLITIMASLCPVCSPSFSSFCGFCLFSYKVQNHEPMNYLPVYLSSEPSTLGQLSALYSGKAALERNLQCIDQCCVRVTEVIQELVSLANAYQIFVVSQLQAWKATLTRDISNSVAEAEAVIAGKQREYQECYTCALLSCLENDFSLFDYQISIPSLEDLLYVEFSSLQLPELRNRRETRSINAPALAKYQDFPCFDLTTMQMSPQPASSPFLTQLKSPAWCLISENRVLCCYFEHPRSRCSLFDAKGLIGNCPDLLFPHTCGGLVVWRRAVHIFGGCEHATKGERLSLSLSHWALLPPMQIFQPECSPVVWQDAIYICGNSMIEVYDGAHFKALYFQMRGHIEGCAVVKEELVVVMSRHTMAISSSKKGLLARVVKEETQIPIVSAWSTRGLLSLILGAGQTSSFYYS